MGWDSPEGRGRSNRPLGSKLPPVYLPPPPESAAGPDARSDNDIGTGGATDQFNSPG